MNIKPIRRYRRRLTITSGLIKNNPVAVLGIALPFIIVPCNSLKAAVLMSAFLFAATVPCAIFSSLIKGRIKTAYLVVCCTVMAMGFVMLTKRAISGYAVLLDAMGLYIPLAAVNSMMLEMSVFSPRDNWIKALCDSVLMCMGFSLVACSIGAIREILGNQTIWDVPFVVYPVRMVGVGLPFFGFIMIGFLTAICRSFDRILTRLMLIGEPSYVEPVEQKQDTESAGDIA